MRVGGSTIVLTGATSGIGRATAQSIAAAGPGRLVVHGPQDEAEVAELIGGLSAHADVVYLRADYGDLADVARLAADVRAACPGGIDVLVNNAARPGAPSRTLTGDGHEATFQVNYLAPVLLTTLLLDTVGAGRPGRLVNVASATHYSASLRLDDLTWSGNGYSPAAAYARSKLAVVTWSCRLATRRPRETLDVVSIHPGVIATGLLHAMFSAGGDSPEYAAANLLDVVRRDHDNGTYYDERRPATPSPVALDAVAQELLDELTRRALAPVLPAATA
ncbi:SDR family NAD(P)-dependent oxidoreductase [Jiangella mangrovi]|uniref:NAD(P)-dependent dehydrogenase (Short-subunit alcohol dehydrogenase family) n=1 Tax=Jiangella mangrovi TaxID=1524084 RepID=A0A7W9GT22_9ACTN|nr:SDR family NAD(P)-dependent oxidoreductase [Jiangella mangrovi]MBB5789527.1 NAD(P)-dependent dehydrogenase (short-subunit alcohol dehydrogenase family) [Jiangella mangrovi]